MKSLVFFLMLPVMLYSQLIGQTIETYPDLKLNWLSDEVVVSGPDEVWVNEIEFMGDRIIVENGAKLTITNTLTMKPNGKIIVQRGGQLVIDGSTITGNDMWAGIEVWGTYNQPQNIEHQGLVRIIGGTIENAENSHPNHKNVK